MNWDYKYKGRTIQERFDEMIGRNDTPLGFLFRLCVVGFCVFTTLDPSASYYMTPFMWAVAWGFVYFYM